MKLRIATLAALIALSGTASAKEGVIGTISVDGELLSVIGLNGPIMGSRVYFNNTRRQAVARVRYEFSGRDFSLRPGNRKGCLFITTGRPNNGLFNVCIKDIK